MVIWDAENADRHGWLDRTRKTRKDADGYMGRRDARRYADGYMGRGDTRKYADGYMGRGDTRRYADGYMGHGEHGRTRRVIWDAEGRGWL